VIQPEAGPAVDAAAAGNTAVGADAGSSADAAAASDVPAGSAGAAAGGVTESGAAVESNAGAASDGAVAGGASAAGGETCGVPANEVSDAAVDRWTTGLADPCEAIGDDPAGAASSAGGPTSMASPSGGAAPAWAVPGSAPWGDRALERAAGSGTAEACAASAPAEKRSAADG
jgi:hypothetical protein